MHQWIWSDLIQIMACHLISTKALSKPMLDWLFIVNWTLWNKLQWNFLPNEKIFIHKNASENIVCIIAAILSRWRWIHDWWVWYPLWYYPQMNANVPYWWKVNIGQALAWYCQETSWCLSQCLPRSMLPNGCWCPVFSSMESTVKDNICTVWFLPPAFTVIPLTVGQMWEHYNDVIMGAMASQTTSLIIVYSTLYSGTDQRKHQSSPSLAFVRGIHRWPVVSFPAQRASNAENVSIWWRHYEIIQLLRCQWSIPEEWSASKPLI